MNVGLNVIGDVPVARSDTAPALDKTAVVAATALPVLVAIDMSADSRAALVWASEHAALRGAPLVVLHVLHDPANAPGRYNGTDPMIPLQDRAEGMLSEFIAEVRAANPEIEMLAAVDTRVVQGLPAGRIVDEAVRLNAGLIVVGTRGQTGLPRLLNGSTAQKVLQLSPIPVTVVKAKQ